MKAKTSSMLFTIFFIAMVIFMVLKMEIGIFLFMTPFIFLFALCPFTTIFIKDENLRNKIYVVLFVVRIYLYYYFGMVMFGIDFAGTFIFGFAINPLLCFILKKNYNNTLNESIKFLQPTDVPVTINNNINTSQIKETTINNQTQPSKKAVVTSSFNPIYSLPEGQMIEEFIKKELEKAGIDKKNKLIPQKALKKKYIMSIIFSILTFIFVSMIFFHYPLLTYIIGFSILIILLSSTLKYDLVKYLIKEIKARPQEKITNVVMNSKSTLVNNNSRILLLCGLVVSLVLPLFIFNSPRIIYEKHNDGYAVRYYIFGLNNFKTANIPETYKNEKVVSLRGNTFSNMPFLESISLPNSITEIRGQAFKNCTSLTEINIPSNLEYLGGGAFYNAKSIKSIELPDTLTYLGGESFYGASSLEYIKLSSNMSEIRGDSFEYCTSLRSIFIPDNIVRIGGHAFYGDTSLSEVSITENSKLAEIGSSAFRQCTSLYNITIPYKTYVNERAFKESPTTVNRFGYNENNEYTGYNMKYNLARLNPNNLKH